MFYYMRFSNSLAAIGRELLIYRQHPLNGQKQKSFRIESLMVSEGMTYSKNDGRLVMVNSTDYEDNISLIYFDKTKKILKRFNNSKL